MKVETDFMTSVPVRVTGDWKTTEPTPVFCKCHIIRFLDGDMGVALLPQGSLFTESERVATLARLKIRHVRQYDNTDATQKVMVDGQPFVDAPTLESYLNTDMDDDFKSLVSPPLNRLKAYLEMFGIKVQVLIDDATGKPYPAGVFRTISVAKGASVLHCDDLGRDGLHKPDFKLPAVLQGRYYNQVSFNFLLDDGGHEADSLWVYNRPYTEADEEVAYPNGWQFPNWLVEDAQFVKHTPQVGQAYGFSTTLYHDVRGGSPLANRVTFSVFGIWVKELNTLYLYN